jgi:cobalt-zinc-cadmium resistance protein CzcA
LNEKKRKIMRNKIIWLLICNALIANAQKPLSLNEALEIAYENNAAIQSAYYEVEASRSLSKTGFDLNKTQVYFQAEERSRELPGIASLGFSQRISYPGRYIHQKNLLDLNLDITEEQLALQKRTVAQKTASSYYRLKFLQSQQKLMMAIDSLLRNMREISNERYEAGETGRAELVNARALSMEFNARLQRLREDIRIEEKLFNSFLQAEDSFTVEQAPIERLEVAYDQIANWQEAHPNGRIFSYLQQSSERNVQYRRSFLFPDLNVQYFMQEVDGQSGFYGFNVGLYIPLWFKPQAKALQAAQYRRQVVSKEVHNNQVGIESGLAALQTELVKNENLLEYYEDQGLDVAQELAEIAQLEYEAGNMNYMEYLQSIRQAFEMEINYLNALNNYNQTVIRINYWTYESISN